MENNVKSVLGLFSCVVSALKQKNELPIEKVNETLLKLEIELDRAITEGKPTDNIAYLIEVVKNIKK